MKRTATWLAVMVAAATTATVAVAAGPSSAAGESRGPHRTLSFRRCARQSAQPDGIDEFWNWYASRVEFAPPDSEDDLRTEFFPPEPRVLDMDDYYSAVRRAHITDLSLEEGTQAA